MCGDLEWVSWMTGGREGRKEGGSERVLPFRASPTTTKTKFIFRRKTLKTTTVTSFSALHIEREEGAPRTVRNIRYQIHATWTRFSRFVAF